ncbi:MAG: lytic transglycosylase domain-containing protein [Bacteroides sp.]|nr:lytic transglycosylase domain-containing protein [Eubacterium sp.]MCM1417886.1 lytic transglycosylase domain-containing protein [Roseburia sp.]MCM1461950.1 lytic transglycosylase domain-containing protein [Bacteroides sp.]
MILLGFILLIALAAIGGIYAYQKCQYEFLLSSHPLRFTEYVEASAEEFGVDPYLLYAVIKTESSFDPSAVSEVGARGLTQIMEETFEWIRFRLGEEAATVYDDMFDPAMNIRYGAYLMSYLLEKFGDVREAAAAYHSGAGSVSEWLSDAAYSADGERLDTIPSSSASHYVDKILAAYENYYKLYEGGGSPPSQVPKK